MNLQNTVRLKIVFHKFLNHYLFLIIFLTASCAQAPLLQELDQRDANEVMVLLAKNGIAAKKEVVEKQQKTTWTLLVSPGDQERARELLVANNLPRQKQLGLKGVCEDAGPIPTPKTEKCRELLAIKGEIINSFTSIPGVIGADVVLSIPEKQDFPDENTPAQRPTASVVIQVAETMVVEQVLPEDKIQQFVANAVTGMDPRDVAVIVSRVSTSGTVFDAVPPDLTTTTDTNPDAISTDHNEETVEFAGMTLDAESAHKFKVAAVVLLAFFVILSGGLIFVLTRMAKLRQRETNKNNELAVLPEKAGGEK